MNSPRTFSTLVLTASLGLGFAPALRAAAFDFTLKTTKDTGVKIAWFQGNSDGAKVEFRETANSTSPSTWIKKGASGDANASWINVGAKSTAYQGKVTDWTFNFNVELAVEGSTWGGAITGRDKLTIKTGLAGGKPTLSVTHLSGKPVLKVIDASTLQVLD